MDKNLLTIKQYAYDTCRYALTNDSRMESSYIKYLESAKYNPAYAEGIFKRAMLDNNSKNVQNIKNSFDSYNNKIHNVYSSQTNLLKTIYQLEEKYKEHIYTLKDSYKTIYPKYYAHRMAINTVVQDQTYKLQKCSNSKFLKKLILFFTK